jgi:hypothetical protein
MSENIEDGQLLLEKLTCRVTRDALERLQAECRRRYADEASYTPMGKVITELLTENLPDAPGSPANGHRRGRRRNYLSPRVKRKAKAKAKRR